MASRKPPAPLLLLSLGLQPYRPQHLQTRAPSLPHLICAVGTASGLVSVSTDETVSLLTSHNPYRSNQNRSHTPYHQHTRNPRDVFDLDFHPTNPNILFSGGRQPRVWIKDTRTPTSEPCRHIAHPSSVARLRAISENQLLVCGPQSAMAIYDVRFFPTSSQGGDHDAPPRRPRPGPLLTFPEYVNGAHLAVGFDVSRELGIAAAAQDDGTVGLFSLATGRRLPCPAMEARGKMGMPIKSLVFQTVPGENSQSLFVGEGLWLRKYSFGTRELDAW
uniref:Uncharacterized protein n=1 Tax=Bionectria ochroleuca TaxID=29856 RepID=A0A8H7TNS7_BIOOC